MSEQDEYDEEGDGGGLWQLPQMSYGQAMQEAGIPANPKVFLEGDRMLVDNFDRMTQIGDFRHRVEEDDGSTFYFFTTEELREVNILRQKGANNYVRKTWLNGFTLKIHRQADFLKYNLSETLQFPLSNRELYKFPRHMPSGNYTILHEMFGYISVEEDSHIRHVERLTGRMSENELGGQSAAVGGSNSSSSSSQQTVKVATMMTVMTGPPLQIEAVNLETLEDLKSYLLSIPDGQEKPSPKVTMANVVVDVEMILGIQKNMSSLGYKKEDWEKRRWQSWSYDKLIGILKSSLNNNLETSANMTSTQKALATIILKPKV
jgi:hypothetical protein